MAVKVVSCTVCSKFEDVKYKCPACRAAYCSVTCCREHKLICSIDDKADQEPSEPAGADDSTPDGGHSRTKYNYETEDTVPIERLELLRDSPKLKDLLGNPHLRRMIEAIDRAGDAADLIGQAMREPIFTEMTDECLRIIGGEQEAESGDELS